MDTPIRGTNQGGPEASGPGTGQEAAPAGVGQLWRWWLATVEGFARQGKTRGRVDPQEYRTLHRGLIATCRALASDPDDPKREVYEQVESLVSPWLSVRSLEQADGEILNDLLLKGRQITGRRWATAVRRGARILLPILAVAGGSFLVIRTADWVLFPFLGWANGWVLEARWALTRPDATTWLFAGGGLLILLACYLVSRAVRG